MKHNYKESIHCSLPCSLSYFYRSLYFSAKRSFIIYNDTAKL